MPRRFMRAKRPTGRELFWVRYSGAVTQINVAGGVVGSQALLDTRNFEPSSTAYGEDVSRKAMTLHRLKFNYITTFNTLLGGTAEFIDIYYGILFGSTNAGYYSPSVGAADTQRADWMDLWLDSVPVGVGGAGNRTGGSFPKHNQRDIKTKRTMRMTLDEGLVYTQVYFPHAGLFTSGTLNTQFVVSMLLSKA